MRILCVYTFPRGALTQDVATEYYSEMDEVSTKRSALARKCVKNPNIDDCRRALDEVDYQRFMHVRQAVVELRDHYATMHHAITANWQMITQPRLSEHRAYMY